MPSPSVALLRTQSDDRLARLAATGHERAFEAIVERYRRQLLRHARRYLSDARAEDAVQQALVAAWTALRRGDEVRDLRPWLHRIAHNSALNALRAPGYDYDELRATLEGSGGPAELAERRAVVRGTLAGLAALPERQRQALLQIAVEGRSQDEVAEQLGLSQGAVRQLVHRARTALRAAATALVPLPLATWLATAGGGRGDVAARVAELVAGAGGSAALAKAGAVAVIAGGAVAGPAVVHDVSDRERQPVPDARAGADREPGTPAAVAAAAPAPELAAGPAEPRDGTPGADEGAQPPHAGRDAAGRSGADGHGGSGPQGDDRGGPADDDHRNDDERDGEHDGSRRVARGEQRGGRGDHEHDGDDRDGRGDDADGRGDDRARGDGDERSRDDERSGDDQRPRDDQRDDSDDARYDGDSAGDDVRTDDDDQVGAGSGTGSGARQRQPRQRRQRTCGRRRRGRCSPGGHARADRERDARRRRIRRPTVTRGRSAVSHPYETTHACHRADRLAALRRERLRARTRRQQ